MIELVHVYFLTGAYLLYSSFQCWQDRANPRRMSTASFWFLLALTFLFGDWIAAEMMGAMVIVLALIAGTGGVKLGRYPDVPDTIRKQRANALGHKLFGPALLIPAITLIGTLALKHVQVFGVPVLSATHTTVISLGVACLLAFITALWMTKEKTPLAIQSARHMLDAIGWAALLPLLLAMLGGVFTQAGVGALVADILTRALPLDLSWVAILAYAVGMALFTMVMGNAFAAFPVLTVGIGLPVLVQLHGANPAPLAAIGMLSGYCGTLMTPMAANFNIVPAALLELRDQNGVIRAQVMTAIPLLFCNIVLMYWLVL